MFVRLWMHSTGLVKPADCESCSPEVGPGNAARAFLKHHRHRSFKEDPIRGLGAVRCVSGSWDSPEHSFVAHSVPSQNQRPVADRVSRTLIRTTADDSTAGLLRPGRGWR